MNVQFSDVTSPFEWDQVVDNRCKDLQNRTEQLKDSNNVLTAISEDQSISIGKIVDSTNAMKLVLGILTLANQDLITKEESRRLLLMLNSPDEENWVVAKELIENKLNELREGKI